MSDKQDGALSINSPVRSSTLIPYDIVASVVYDEISNCNAYHFEQEHRRSIHYDQRQRAVYLCDDFIYYLKNRDDDFYLLVIDTLSGVAR